MSELDRTALRFVLVGGLLFAAHAWLQPADELRLPEAEAERLSKAFEVEHGRGPGAAEREALEDGWRRDEALFREALSLGLERTDPVVRRRLVQDMEFLLEPGELPAPSTAELAAHLAAHATDYAHPRTLSFRHVFFAGADALARANAALASPVSSVSPVSPARGADVGALGDAFGHGSDMRALSDRRIRALFGEPFAARLWALDAAGDGQGWRGPLSSRLGAHLVWIEARSPARPARLAEVRDQLTQDFWSERRARARQAAEREVLGRYAPQDAR